MQQELAMNDSAPRLRRLGKYELIARIGSGGMAEVYLARQHGPMKFEKVVVVKTIHSHLARQQEFIDMLLDEARLAARLKHPSVVDIYDLGVEGETYFIAMEYLAGESLLTLLRAAVNDKPLDVRSTARIIADVADGLHCAHELADHDGRSLELVHRDITPGNIVVLYAGQAKIVDFGIAKARGRMAEDTGDSHFKGKLGYVSPEQIENLDLDRRSDIFSLGIVMWEALAMKRLFRQKTPAAVTHAIMTKSIEPPSTYRSDVPPKLDSICMRALARDRNERYDNAAEMYEDIEKFLSAASFRPQRKIIATYMQEVFAGAMAERDSLLRQVAHATAEIEIEMIARSSTDDGLDCVASGYSGEITLPPDASIAAALAAVLLPVAPGAIAHSPAPADRRRAVTIEELTSGERVPGTFTRHMTGAEVPRKPWMWAAITAPVLLLGIVVVGLLSGDNPPAPTAAANRDSSSETEQRDHAGQPGGDGRVLAAATQEPVGTAAWAAEPEPVSPGDEDGDDAPDQDESDAEAASQQAEAEAASQQAEDDSGAETDAAAADKPDQKRDKSSTGRTRSTTGSSASRTVDPALAKDLYKQGISSFVAGHSSTAIYKFKKALRANPAHAEAYRGLGMVYERAGKKKKASWAFRQYLRLAPSASDSAAIRKRLAALGS